MRTTFALTILLACSGNEPPPPEPLAPEPLAPEPPPAVGDCGDRLREHVMSLITASPGMRAYVSVPLPISSGTAFGSTEDESILLLGVQWTGGGWSVTGDVSPTAETVEAMATRIRSESERVSSTGRTPLAVVQLAVPPDLPAAVVPELADAVGDAAELRLITIPPEYRAPPQRDPELVHTEVAELGRRCAPLLSLHNAGTATLRSGMADPAFEAINECCDRLDPRELLSLFTELRRPHHWVRVPSTPPGELTVQAWLDQRPTD